MITSLITSLMRVTIFWYVIGALVLFIGDPSWAESLYRRLMVYPWVPALEMHGLGTAAAVQWRLLMFWTVPLMGVWGVSLATGVAVAEVQCQIALRKQRSNLKPVGEFWKVVVPNYSIGRLPPSTTPALTGQRVSLDAGHGKDVAYVALQGKIAEATKALTVAERQLAEQLLQLLLQSPDHYAGAGHGVGLLEHTLNVVTEAAGKVTPEFRMPLLAALSHDIGKLITFQPDGAGGWKKKGLHSRESARILATLPAFQDLPELHQRALLLAVKYDHAPNKMPELRGERDACTLAMRTISALAQADRKATADEKERNLVRLQPEDLLWQDFVDFLREAPVVQRGKKGVANQVNNPPDTPYLFVYEAPWRDAAVRRLPEEVAAALDLTRRDAGKMAKYTRILVERLRKEGVLVESYSTKGADGVEQNLKVSDTNPLWDIQSGTGEKAVVLRGILVLHADTLWKKLNYRISVKSPFPVQILAPNADVDGRVNDAPRANRDAVSLPDLTDGMKVADVDSSEAMAALGLTADAVGAGKPAKPKTRARGGFNASPAPSPADDAVFGLKTGAQSVETPPVKSAPVAPVDATVEQQAPDEVVDLEAEAMAAEMAAAMAGEQSDAASSDDGPSAALDNALAFLTQFDDSAPTEPPAPAQGEPDTSLVVMPAPDEVAIANAEQGGDTAPAKQQPEPTVAAQARQVEKPIAATPAREPKPVATPAAPPTSSGPKKPNRTGAVKRPDDTPRPAVTAPAKAAPVPTAAPSLASAAAPGEPVAAAADAGDADALSRSERREGLAIADEAAVAKYPNLKVGDKYYTEHSREVQSGRRKTGSQFKGDLKEKAPEATDAAPRRGRRRF